MDTSVASLKKSKTKKKTKLPLNTVTKYEDKIIDSNLNEIAKGSDEEITCACKEIIDEDFTDRFQDKVHQRLVDVDHRIRILCRNNYDHFLKKLETFHTLK